MKPSETQKCQVPLTLTQTMSHLYMRLILPQRLSPAGLSCLDPQCSSAAGWLTPKHHAKQPVHTKTLWQLARSSCAKTSKKGIVKLFSDRNESFLRQQSGEAAKRTVPKVTAGFPYA